MHGVGVAGVEAGVGNADGNACAAKSKLLGHGWGFSSSIIATNDLTTYCVPLPNPWSFFLVEEGDALFNPIVNTNAPAALSVTSSSKGSLVRFSANVNQRFQLQWTDSLRSPAWNTFDKVVTSTNGLYQFLDDGSQSGGLNAKRIYRAVPLH